MSHHAFSIPCSERISIRTVRAFPQSSFLQKDEVSLGCANGLLRGQYAWEIICSTLSLADQIHVGSTNRSMRILTTLVLKQSILKIKKAFKKILNFPLLEEQQLNDPTNCREVFPAIIGAIYSCSVFAEIWRAKNKDFAATAQEIKELYFLRFFHDSLPIDVQHQVDLMESASNQTRFVKKWLEEHRGQFAAVTELERSNFKLISIPPELFQYYPNLQRLNLVYSPAMTPCSESLAFPKRASLPEPSALGYVNNLVGGSSAWKMICSALPVIGQFRLGSVNRSMKILTAPVLKQSILKIREEFKEILNFPLLEEQQLDDPTNCRKALSAIVETLCAPGAPPDLEDILNESIPEFLEIWRAKNKDFAATAQEIKDRDFLRLFHGSLPIDVQRQVDPTKSISEQVGFIKKWLEEHRDQFLAVTELKRNDCHLTSIPPELFQFYPNLQRLDLSNNQIRIIPDTIKRLILLKTLNLSGNLIQIIPDTIRCLVLLETLNLSGNLIQIIPDAIGVLVLLKTLDLSNNQIQIIPDVIRFLVLLKTLDLSNDSIQSAGLGSLETRKGPRNQIQVIPDAIGALGNLRELVIRFNQIQTISDAIGALGNLRKLDLWGNQIQVIPGTIGGLVNLQYLTLYQNQIKVIPDAVGDLVNLVTLQLSHNHIAVIPAAMRKLFNLQKLSLEHNELRDIPEALGALINLRELELYGNQFEDIPTAVRIIPHLNIRY